MPRPPDVVLVLTTQWRWDMFGFAGHLNAQTPALDALAGEARVFRQAVTPHPFGPMARAALLTGVPSPLNGVRDYFDPLPADAVTLANRFRERGYRTAFFGKWHLAPRNSALPLVGEAHARTRVPPERRGGFDFWEGFESGFLLNNPWLQGTRLTEPTQFEGYQSDVVCERAAAWHREQAREKPTFLVVSLEAPHPPYNAPAPGGLGPDERTLHLPANVPPGPTEARARAELSGYLRHVRATDAAIGRLFGATREAATRTRFVVTSVHGDMQGAHGLFRKGWPHEESVRVPLLDWSSDSRSASLEDRPTSLLTLPDLLLAAADDRTWAPSGDPVAIGMPSVVQLPWQCTYVWRGLRSATRKIVLDEQNRTKAFHDLAADPLELHNAVDDPAYAREVGEWTRLARQLVAGFA